METSSARVRLHPQSVRLLRAGLLMVAVATTMPSAVLLLQHHPIAVDLEIPLRAAQRWLRGEPPYLASAFEVTGGPELPFLYPPVVLPILAPLVDLPRWLLSAAWLSICVGCALYALARFRVPAAWWPLFLLSPPFLEPLLGGNVQLVMLALFAWLFFRGGPGPAFSPLPRDPTATERPGWAIGLGASLIAAFKVSQAHAWGYLLIRRPRAALVGAGLLVAVAVATLPVTGIGLWLDWLGQLRRAADPAWLAGGISVGRYLPAVVALAVSLGSALALALVPRRRAGEWIGILTVLGAPSLHVFGVLPMLPAFLRVRRELALVAAAFVGTLTEPGLWLAVALVAVSYVGGTRWPHLLEAAEPGGGAARSPGGRPSGS
ncbi:MAG: hypothetical protein KatS3mg065_0873 [Chloroflexota bacterium]|nr:MAG: hypothetical protein KatS3mg065_0873 [Chloroflexota bacterium]